MSKFCTNCGTELEEDAAFCTNCGTPAGADSNESDVTSAGSAVVGESGNIAIDQAETQVIAPDTSGIDVDTTELLTPVSQSAANATATHNAAETQRTASFGNVVSAPQAAYTATQAGASGYAAGQNSSNKRTMIIAVVVALVVIAVAAIVAAFVLSGPGNPEQNEVITSSGAAAMTNETYEVMYETGGGSTISVTEVEAGDTITSPSEPTRNGYKFAGWYLDPSYTDPATFPMTVNQDMILYAKWDSTTGASGSSASSPSAAQGQGTNAAVVTLTVVGADGATQTAQIHRDGSTGRVFPNSNTVELSESEVAALSNAERCVAWNEIIASITGYEFKNSGLKNYFTNSCSWYKPNANGSSSVTGVAAQNVNLLKSYTSDWWQHLATN